MQCEHMFLRALLLGLLDYQAMKNAVLPRVKRLCISTTLLSVRVNSLICLGKLLTHLDKWLVIDEILPMLQQIPSREPAVIMGIIGKKKNNVKKTARKTWAFKIQSDSLKLICVGLTSGP